MPTKTFDVFLSYNRKDAPAVRELGRELRERKLKVWLDEWELMPGRLWQEELEREIQTARSAAVIIGKDGLGSWEALEMRSLLDQARQRSLCVIPVLLPDASPDLILPLFLAQFMWVDLRAGLTKDGLNRLQWGITGVKPESSEPPEDPALETYRAWAREHYRGLNLIGLGGGDVRMRFEEVYVPLRIARRPERIELEGPGGKEHERFLREAAEDLKIEEVFTAPHAAGRHALILGHPGSGKSTALLKLLHQCLTAGPQSLGLAAGTVPVFLRLRRLTPADLDRNRPLATLLARELAEVSGGALPADLVDVLWNHGRLLLLLDGLDEIADEALRSRVCQDLDWELAGGDRRQVRSAISCRFAGYGAKVQLGDSFLPLEVRPLDADQCRHLVRHWFQEAPRALPDFPLAKARKAAEGLVAALDGPGYGTQAWKVLIGSPLLLTLLCIIVLRGGQMPRHRVAFYDESLRVLLGRWGPAKRSETEAAPEPPLDVETALAVLRFLAWQLHTRGSRDDLSRLEALDHIEDRLSAMGKEPNGFGVLAWLHREAGILAEYAPGEYGFLHLGLQEYLTALEIASQGETLLDDLAAHWDEEWWHEVILLLAGLPGRRLFAPLMQRLLGSPALLAREDLLRACLEETAEVDLEPFLAGLNPSDPPERQAAVLRLLRGRSDPRLLPPALGLQGSPDPDVKALAEQLVAELSGARSAASQATIDLLLIYHPGDLDGASGLARHLERAGMRIALVTQEPLSEVLIEGTRAVAVLAGPAGQPPWELPELARYLRLFVRRRRLILPVRLPGSGDAPSLPRDLPDVSWIDLRAGLSSACVTTIRHALAGEAGAAPGAKISPEPDKAFTEPLTGIRFLWIPGGRFQMGGNAYPDEQPVHWVRISPFWLGETPVTNRQYAVFLKAEKHNEPDYWRDKRYSSPEQPVVGVSWNDAQAFCTWLSKTSGWQVMLPGEAQWEFAARGTDGREYPWGNEPPDETRACFNLDFQKGQPAPAGCFPAGRGPFGSLDQAGNVWEWCRDSWDATAYKKTVHAHESLNPIVEVAYMEDRVLRGGGWYFPAESLRAAYRLRDPAWNRTVVLGFRVAAAPQSTLSP
ncbi:MAG TPA: SUMF1/EgtB/PvdO family nonheme iron enzyme [Thermoanaerobaculia bacterium]|nr:SUMF1/EgtB/PvdO family nonheme iron enzyme [Thermoanaerobaculia bacterium]